MPPGPARILPRWRTDAFLAAAIALNYAARGVLPVVLPAVKADFHLSDAALGLLGSLFFWTYAAAAPFTGFFGDRYSRRLLVLISVSAWSLTTLLTGASNGWIMLVVLRIAFGLSESLYLPAAAALQADHHGPATRTLAMGLNNLAQNLGPVVGAACAGWLADRWGWRSSFAGLGFVGVALALSAPRFLSDAPVLHAKPMPRAKAGEALSYLARDGTYLVLVANEMISGVAVWIFFFWLPSYLFDTYGVTMAAAGFSGMAMQQLSSFAGTGVGTWLSHRAPGMSARLRQFLFAITSIAAAPCLLCFLFHPRYVTVAVAISIFNLLRAFGGVFELPVLCDVVPISYRSTAVGILISGACSAGGLGVLAAGVLKRSLGLTGVFVIMTGVAGLAGLALLLGWWKFMTRDLARAEVWTEAHGAPAIH
jgi:MFS family permease